MLNGYEGVPAEGQGVYHMELVSTVRGPAGPGRRPDRFSQDNPDPDCRIRS